MGPPCLQVQNGPWQVEPGLMRRLQGRIQPSEGGLCPCSVPLLRATRTFSRQPCLSCSPEHSRLLCSCTHYVKPRPLAWHPRPCRHEASHSRITFHSPSIAQAQ